MLRALRILSPTVQIGIVSTAFVMLMRLSYDTTRPECKSEIAPVLTQIKS
jgi:hypothetical protein